MASSGVAGAAAATVAASGAEAADAAAAAAGAEAADAAAAGAEATGAAAGAADAAAAGAEAAASCAATGRASAANAASAPMRRRQVFRVMVFMVLAEKVGLGKEKRRALLHSSTTVALPQPLNGCRGKLPSVF